MKRSKEEQKEDLAFLSKCLISSQTTKQIKNTKRMMDRYSSQNGRLYPEAKKKMIKLRVYHALKVKIDDMRMTRIKKTQAIKYRTEQLRLLQHGTPSNETKTTENKPKITEKLPQD